MLTRIACAAFALGACTPAAPEQPPPAARVAPPERVAARDLPPVPVDAGAPAPDAAAEGVPPVAPAGARNAAFPPKPVTPPFARSAAPGDGEWTALPGSADTMLSTVVHPHPVSRFLSVHVVAIDLGRTELGWLPGTADVDAKTLPGVSVGLVPPELQPRLIAVFNGGFQPQHGRWGMKLGANRIVPPRDVGCTIALGAGGALRIAPWPEIAPIEAELRAYRQTPPCMLVGGELHPQLAAGNERPWGGHAKDLVTRRRSAIGTDAAGRVLYYALGIEVGPRLLAEGLRYAGASEAAELDINFNWTRFLLFGRTEPNGGLTVLRPLLPDMPFGRSGYVSRKNDRDFFYVLRKPDQASD